MLQVGGRRMENVKPRTFIFSKRPHQYASWSQSFQEITVFFKSDSQRTWDMRELMNKWGIIPNPSRTGVILIRIQRTFLKISHRENSMESSWTSSIRPLKLLIGYKCINDYHCCSIYVLNMFNILLIIIIIFNVIVIII